MEAELLQDMITYLGDDYDKTQEAILLLLIKNALRAFKSYINYPNTFSDEKISSDLEKNYPCLFDLVVYRQTKQGMEFANSFSESGTSRSWDSEAQIYSFYGVVPFANM